MGLGWDYVGLYGIMWDYVGLCGIMWDYVFSITPVLHFLQGKYKKNMSDTDNSIDGICI